MRTALKFSVFLLFVFNLVSHAAEYKPHFVNVILSKNSEAVWVAQTQEDSYTLGAWKDDAISIRAESRKKPALISGSTADFMMWQTTPENIDYFLSARENAEPIRLSGDAWNQLKLPYVWAVCPEKKCWLTESFLTRSKKLYTVWTIRDNVPCRTATHESPAKFSPGLAASLSTAKNSYFIVAENATRLLGTDKHKLLVYSLDPFQCIAEINSPGRAHRILTGPSADRFEILSCSDEYRLETYQIEEAEKAQVHRTATKCITNIPAFVDHLSATAAGFLFTTKDSSALFLMRADSGKIHQLGEFPVYPISGFLTFPDEKHLLAWTNDTFIKGNIEAEKLTVVGVVKCLLATQNENGK